MARRELSSIALIVLGLLDEGPLHPYEILRIMRKHRDDLRVPVSVGSIYHAVERLEREGYVVPLATGREGARPERTTYEITDAGRDEHRRRTRELLRTVQPEYPAFDVGLGQADALEADEVVALLRERLDTVRDEQAAYDAALRSIVARGVPRRHLLDALYELEQRATQIAWIERTVAEIESGELDWTTPHLPRHGLDTPSHTPDDATSSPQKDLV
ncbi:MAG TPA: PadR family transcriptional regulator [Luteimicrobium sp.]|jgi:DNA-binding PadR family transcriptional regulator|nr:PadR family transcriptional regulator [Luteimicrobium sp.]